MLKLWSIARYIRENDIEVIHAHLPWAGVLARFVGKKSGKPVIYTEHNKQERYHKLTRWMNVTTLDMANVVVPVSEDVAQSVRKFKPDIKAQIKTIVNGVDTDYFHREGIDKMIIRRKLNIPNGSIVIGTIAVFRFQKRLGLWMDLAKKILNLHKDVHFIIVGDGPLKDDLVRKRQALGLEDRIHMPGLEKDVKPYLSTFDIYMMCSIFEGLPVALLEAMAMECPIISTNAGGIKEVINHERDGLLTECEDPDKLVQFASNLIESEEKRLQFGKNARLRVLSSFNMDKMVNELEALYLDIASMH
jgi:glycosyltransferase involved in cell wall biosynthesis